MDCSMTGFSVHHQLLEVTQTHVHQVSNAIQPSHPLSSPYLTFNLSQHQGLLKWVSSSPSGSQSIRISALASVFPMNIQDWSPLGWTGWISLQSKGLSRVSPQHHSSKALILWYSAFFRVQLSHPYMTTGKTIALIWWTFDGKAMPLLFNTVSRLVITFLPRSKCLFSHHIQWFWSPKNKVWPWFHCFPIYLPWSDGTGCWWNQSNNLLTDWSDISLCPGIINGKLTEISEDSPRSRLLAGTFSQLGLQVCCDTDFPALSLNVVQNPIWGCILCCFYFSFLLILVYWK